MMGLVGFVVVVVLCDDDEAVLLENHFGNSRSTRSRRPWTVTLSFTLAYSDARAEPRSKVSFATTCCRASRSSLSSRCFYDSVSSKRHRACGLNAVPTKGDWSSYCCCCYCYRCGLHITRDRRRRPCVKINHGVFISWCWSTKIRQSARPPFVVCCCWLGATRRDLFLDRNGSREEDDDL
jgi:hypothetical protein